MNQTEAREELQKIANIFSVSLPLDNVLRFYTLTHYIQIGAGKKDNQTFIIWLDKQARPGTWRGGRRCPRNSFTYNPKLGTFKKLAMEMKKAI